MDRRQVRVVAALSISLWWARRIVRQRLEAYDPAGRVPASRLLNVMTGQGGEEFERLTVEQFLIHAFNSPHPFEGEEWADRQEVEEEVFKDDGIGGEPYSQKPRTKFHSDRRLPMRLEPPLVRVRCTGCGKEKDAWVDEDGRLEDERDQWCLHNDDSIHPTELAEEDE